MILMGVINPHLNNTRKQIYYDLDADPYELNNLIGISTYDEIVNSLRKKIKSKIKKRNCNNWRYFS